MQNLHPSNIKAIFQRPCCGSPIAVASGFIAGTASVAKKLQRYGDLTVFKMAAVHHLGFLKFKCAGVSSDLSQWTVCSSENWKLSTDGLRTSDDSRMSLDNSSLS